MDPYYPALIFWALVGLLLCFLLIWLRTTKRDLRTWANWAIRIAAWVAFYALLFVALFVPLLMTCGAPLVVAIMVLMRHVATERRALAECLALAARKGIPLRAAAMAFADERRFGATGKARRLAEYLEMGKPLPTALLYSGIRLPTDLQLALSMGYEQGGFDAGAFGPSSTAARLEGIVRGVAAKCLYLLIFVCVALLIMTFVVWRIIPEYIKIFEGFDLELPKVTILVIFLSHFAVKQTTALVLFVVVLWLVLGLLLVQYMGDFRLEIPLVRRLWRRLDRATILRCLAQAVERHRTLPETLAALVGCHPKPHVRRRLRAAQRRIADGEQWCDSLVRAGLVDSADAGVLKAAERVGNLPWAMGEMADRQSRTFVARLSAVVSVVFPATLIVLAIVVMIFSVALFLPLVDLIMVLT